MPTVEYSGGDTEDFDEPTTASGLARRLAKARDEGEFAKAKSGEQTTYINPDEVRSVY